MLSPFIEVVLMLLNLIYYLIMISVIASWLVAFGVVNTRNPTVYRVLNIIARATEPMFRPIRRLIPPVGGMDLSPLVLLLIIYLVQREIEIALLRGYFL